MTASCQPIQAALEAGLIDEFVILPDPPALGRGSGFFSGRMGRTWSFWKLPP